MHTIYYVETEFSVCYFETEDQQRKYAGKCSTPYEFGECEVDQEEYDRMIFGEEDYSDYL